jgi:hypothetical protein
MSDLTYRGFLGDGERDFHLTPALIVELELKVGTGIGALFNRMIARDFRFADIVETVRLGLIGGGASPAEAHQLVDTYVHGRPLAESLPIALSILEAVWFGKSAETVAEGSTDE